MRSSALTRLVSVFLTATLATVAVVYAAFVGWCAWRTARASGEGMHARGVERDALPHVAVLVAARDEEATIARCVEALLAQDYPADRLTIVVADDHSTDRTAEIVQQYTTQPLAPEARPSVRYVSVPDPAGALHGKALAIHTAVEITDAPILLITDADCAPPEVWVRGLVASLDEGVGITGGLTLMEEQTAFGAAQSLDWSYLLGVASALTEAGFPATVMGNNIAFRREAYESVGGYPGIPFSVTEDYALFKAIADQGLWRTRFPIIPETLVRTLPARSFSHAYRQRRRWARGGLRAGPTLWAAYILAHLAHLIPLIGLVVAPEAGLMALVVKLAADATLLSTVFRRAGRGRLKAGPFLAFEAFLFLYMTTLPLALLMAPKIKWKGRTH